MALPREVGPTDAYINTPVENRVPELDTNVSPFPFFWVQDPRDGTWFRWFVYPSVTPMPMIPPDAPPPVMPMIP